MPLLNDTEEFALGMRLLQEQLGLALASRHLHPAQKAFLRSAVELARVKTDESPLFVFCASEEGDSMSQWRAYGGSVGYSVGMTVGVEFLSVVDQERPPRPLSHTGPWPMWGKVLYDLADQREVLLKGLAFCAETTPAPGVNEEEPGLALVRASGILTQLAAYCKASAFSDEKEVRLITRSPEDLRAVRFRASRLGVAPFVRLVYPPEWKGGSDSSLTAWWTLAKHERLRLTEIRVGPTPYAEAAAHGMKVLLQARGYLDVPVTRSDVSYR